LPLKLDNLLIQSREHSIDVLELCETWHDSDSVANRRLRADGFSVVERARPRRVDDTLSTNHGGVAVVAVPGLHLSSVDVGVQLTTFELVTARIASNSMTFLVVVVYRPGSSSVTSGFFSELADLLDRLSTYVEPLALVGDVNIRLERIDDSNTIEFRDLLTSYGLVQRVQSATHDAGGTLDAVCTRSDLSSPTVDIFDGGLSDLSLLRWSSHLCRQAPVYTTFVRSRKIIRSRHVPGRPADVRLVRRSVLQ